MGFGSGQLDLGGRDLSNKKRVFSRRKVLGWDWVRQKGSCELPHRYGSWPEGDNGETSRFLDIFVHSGHPISLAVFL